ncbi:MAG: outer membrane beta-barrel family protein, partial [Muribaculaceae bacterium]|nr:outer membrane beta-barrel family protein [Muribaculaceae bacterium]
PDNAITITTFGDWKLDDTGKMLSLTYNIFRRHIHSFSDVTTEDITGAQTSLTDAGKNRYCIHSVKFDASLPFRTFKIETGVAYTGINNKTELEIKNYIGNEWMNNLLQSNSFNYTEHTAAIYASAEKNFSDGLFGKLGLRYEYTDVSGRQPVAAARNDKTYGYIFPSLTLSWNNNRIGRISFSYSSGIIRPSFGDLNPFRYFTTVSDYYSGNPDLKPGITHNAEINYSFKGIYTVIYNSFTHNAIWNVTRFNTDGSQYTQPENCLETNKAGLYASYNRSIFSWWNMNIGGEVYYNYAGSKISDFRDGQDHSWSGKLEFNTSWMLNRSKTLIFNLRFSHLFPHHDKMVRYSSVSLLGCDLRYALLDNRLNLALAVSDPFGWNITKSKSYFSGYTLESRNNIHAHAVSFRVSWSLGRQKVNNPYRDSKERESRRSN